MICPSCGIENPVGASFCTSCGTRLTVSTEPVPSSEPVPPSPKDLTTSRGFVGRLQEMRVLQSALEDVLSGHGRLLILSGEPGIGKTRTVQELATYAQTRGALVLWGRCYEGEGAPPYWPWVQPLKTYLERTSTEELRADLGPGGSDIGEMLPELREKLPGLESPPVLEPERARFRLFNSVTTFLKNVAQRTPLVLVLDDLHWADRSSLLLLQFVSQELSDVPLMILGTYRDVEVNSQHPLWDILGQLSRETVFRRQSLGGLSLEDVGQFMELAAGVRPTQQLLAVVYRRTEGNPFFTAQVVRLLLERGALQETAGLETVASAIPVGVLEAIGRRLNRLSSRCHQTLTTAAVIGREFDFGMLSLLSAGTAGISEEQLLEVIDEALEAHLIEELPGSAEGFQFSHALIRETLARQLSAARRVRLHARVGAALEQLYAADLASHASQLAHHFAQAAPVLGPEKLVRYSGLAGEQALATYAWEEALAHFERGLTARGVALGGTEPAGDAETADLLFGLARAKLATRVGDQDVETFAILSRAFEHYAEVGNIALAVAAAEFPIDNRGGVPGSAELMLRALALVPADSYEAGRLLSRYGGTLGLAQCDYEGAQEPLGRALSIARRERDVPLEVQTLAYAANVSGQHLHWHESINHALRAIALSNGREDNHSAVLFRWWASVSLLHIGDLERARPPALALSDLAAKQSTPRYYSIFGLVPIITLSCLEGDWEAGREYYNRIQKRAPTFQQHLCARVLLEFETGEVGPGKIYLERLLEEMRRGLRPFALGKGPMTLIEVARITDIVDHLDLAESTAKALLSNPTITPIVAMYAKAGLALLSTQQGDQSAAEEHYDYFVSHRGTMMWTLASADRLLGLLAKTMGDLEQAAAHFEDALAFCRKAGYRPELAWSLCDYSDTLVARGQPGDQTRVRNILEECLAITNELGMRPLMERVAARLAGPAAGPLPAPVYPDGLTQREVEVLRLIAQGRSNPAIAQELVVSVRTVTTHVSNIFSKINAANRAEAATYAIRHGLI